MNMQKLKRITKTEAEYYLLALNSLAYTLVSVIEKHGFKKIAQ